ncbi:MAG: signal peptidase II [Firmicutes bacterium]|nr:signal peptidase II [Bacillota bacterium]
MHPLVLVPLLVILDQAIKLFVRYNLHPGRSINLIPGVLKLTYLRNTGAAFGFLAHETEFLVSVGILAVLAVFYFLRRLPVERRWTRYGLSLGLAGAIGNLLDRVRYGYVVDMFQLKHWPGVFNLADVLIISGGILVIIELLRLDERELRK